MVTVRAARYLYDALANRDYDPCKLVPDDFMVAASVCQAREEKSSAYRIGLQLAEICSWVNRYNVARVYIDFKNPIPRLGHEGTRIGKAADDRRADKLPSSAALDALAAIANLATEPADVIRIRAIELLVCGGWRINELLTLPALCEIEEPAMLNGEPVLGPDGEPMLRYGIAYHAEKNAQHRTKKT